MSIVPGKKSAKIIMLSDLAYETPIRKKAAGPTPLADKAAFHRN
jgi:hypothetical protein